MSGPSKKELAIPFAAHESAEATEILRAWIVDNGLHVSLQRAFDDPAVWGVLLTDLARHVSRIYETEGVSTQEEALAKIKFTLDAEWDDGADVGTTSAIQ
ncbi:DUF5076 domain-containing protein [Chelatococcus sambhunathii]|uniref:DUF5076 domain-containing protein n=1 Tax=Chelatococcus sambhunathii TaxID=363953 RepID=A0ABU1DEK0_9HYPH|nr:DUF5076 domain-containing protein [Chelatococcus sambhunathii]MDR4306486.1 DUF5076 domain-containing protein [Chelatococcus sambhunathii]